MNNIADDLAIAYRDGLKDGQPKWIPVTEKLPSWDEDVLVCAYGSMIRVWCFVGLRNGFLCFEDEDGYWETIDAVSHWMPLPEPPKEDEDD